MSFGEVLCVENGRLAIPDADSRGVRCFRGIPFAAPPVGPLRWRPPQVPAPWSGVRRVDAFGANAMQAVMFNDIDPSQPGISEDCLYLNVWTPAEGNAERLPVLFYIHGGGFAVGHGAEPRYSGARLAECGIVVVTFNYRLNVFGFFAHPELAMESDLGACGNYGLLDQLAALTWVKRNIAVFGGDPNCITIAGESAGSMSVSALMASPLAAGLFQRAIGESGSLMPCRLEGTDLSRAAGEAIGVRFADSLGLSLLVELRALSAQALLAALPKDFRFWPVVDGWFLPESPTAVFNAGKQNDVTLLAGWNRDEGFNFDLTRGGTPPFEQLVRDRFPERAEEILALYPAGNDDEAAQSGRDLGGDLRIIQPTWAWMEAQAKTGRAPVYGYRFDHAPAVPESWFGKGAPAGAFHAAEIVYTLDNLDAFPGRYTGVDREIAAMMSAYWVNFVKTGDPNQPGLPVWPTYKVRDRQVMYIGAASHAGPLEHTARYVCLAR
jgi:para-nitrobenzyl esterase